MPLNLLHRHRKKMPEPATTHLQVNSILVVCTGNICRSPLAERLLIQAFPTLDIGSAGIGAVDGYPMDPDASMIANRQLLPQKNHIARQVTGAMVRASDLILVMEARQQTWLEKRYPKSRGRVFLISHWQGNEDVVDPFGCSSAVFDTVYRRLASCVDDWRTHIAA